MSATQGLQDYLSTYIIPAMTLKQLLTQLIKAGWTQARIAERCGTTQTTISDLLRGARKSTGFQIADAIRGLHTKELGKLK